MSVVLLFIKGRYEGSELLENIFSLGDFLEQLDELSAQHKEVVASAQEFSQSFHVFLIIIIVAYCLHLNSARICVWTTFEAPVMRTAFQAS